MREATLFWSILGAVFLSVRGCGEGVRPPPSSKIVGGRDAGEGEFPWQASLQRKSKLGFFHVCGASLVAPRWLLTAAHCIRLNYTNSYRITIGTNNLSRVTTDEIYSIRMIVIKQGFDPRTFSNDIALVQLFRDVPEFLSPVCLDTEDPQKDDTVVVTGWGATSDGGKPSYYLQAADVLWIPREDCLEYYEELTESMTCAGFEEGQTDACQIATKEDREMPRLLLVSLSAVLCVSATTDTENKSKLYQCLNTCAMCVEHWESGLYNGPRCAKQCIKHKGHKIVDPDCVKLKMFNYDPEVLKEHRKFLRQQNEENREVD